MEDLLYQFHHEDVNGAIIRILEDEILSVNEFLAEVHQLDEGDEYEFAYTCCYLKHRGRHILVDAGFDPDTTPGALESIDVFPEDIDWVLITHADRDHVAGLLMQDGSLTYPKARHVISKEVWNFLNDVEALHALDNERKHFYERLQHALNGSVQVYDGDADVTEGIRLLTNPGHRIGHVVYEFATEGVPLVHTGDGFFHPLFAEHPDWANVTDSKPQIGVDSRRQLVDRLAETHAQILSTHIPFPGIGTIRRVDSGLYQWIPTPRQD